VPASLGRLHGSKTTSHTPPAHQGASAILSNGDRWLDSSPAANQLVGEGVYVLTYGELAFRHALLRDFAVSLSLRRHDAAGIANHLKLVTNPAIRNDLLRGVLEARMDPAFADAPGPTVESIVQACASHRLSPGIALGSSDAPTAALVAMLAPLEAGAMFQQTLDRARLVDNRIWIRVIASIGGARPPWLGDAQIDALSRLAQYALETHDPEGEALARTLRGWTLGQVGDTWAMAKILKLVVRRLPDDQTLTWIASLRMRAVVTTGEMLDDLRHMLVSKPGLDADLGQRALANLVFPPGTGDALGNHRQWPLVHRCLLSNRLRVRSARGGEAEAVARQGKRETRAPGSVREVRRELSTTTSAPRRSRSAPEAHAGLDGGRCARWAR
jgi:hypothetical protein